MITIAGTNNTDAKKLLDSLQEGEIKIIKTDTIISAKPTAVESWSICYWFELELMIKKIV
jgi:hypothetical protein